MRINLFAKRNAKEILRDPINLFFGLGFPLILLVMLSVINSSIPAEANNTMFSIENLAPGLAMFGTAFMALFSGMLLSKDRASSFLMRLFASPMTSFDFIVGYTLPMIVMASAQAAITLLASCIVGLELTVNLLLAILVTTLASLLFVGFGLLFGSLLDEKAVGGICGAVLTNVAGFLSGVFIPIDLIGGAFKKTAEILPFYHSVQAIQAVLQGNIGELLPHLTIVLGYSVVIFALAVIVFQRKMSGGKA
ncbi:MAG: ABC transporter permease [Syntrophomonadaceae bacterium]|jgi:ABC-2 type transport system permease protein|nr:ABC transporter permease [Syntrophomonadaceae bacterium]NMB01798.1 ABC transporter permease [Bacillota bacterium]